MRASLVVFFLAAAPAVADEPKVADQELGARVGASLNFAGIAPGGFYVAGSWLYRVTDNFWFDGRAAFTLGGSGAKCTFPSTGQPRCDSALTSGSGGELLAGVRWFVPQPGVVTPWIGGGVGTMLASFSDDNLTGLGIPFWVTGGARARVSDTVSVGAEAVVEFGPVRYGNGIGWQGFADLKLIFGVDFAL